MDRSQASLLGLPRELRNEIHNLCCAHYTINNGPFELHHPFKKTPGHVTNNSTTAAVYATTRRRGSVAHTLAFTCRQIFYEYLDEQVRKGTPIHRLHAEGPLFHADPVARQADALLDNYDDPNLPNLVDAKQSVITIDISRIIEARGPNWKNEVSFVFAKKDFVPPLTVQRRCQVACEDALWSDNKWKVADAYLTRSVDPFLARLPKFHQLRSLHFTFEGAPVLAHPTLRLFNQAIVTSVLRNRPAALQKLTILSGCEWKMETDYQYSVRRETFLGEFEWAWESYCEENGPEGSAKVDFREFCSMYRLQNPRAQVPKSY